jgi:hypothetical protein
MVAPDIFAERFQKCTYFYIKYPDSITIESDLWQQELIDDGYAFSKACRPIWRVKWWKNF